MSSYDFNYIIPNNFNKRIFQYLQQKNSDLATMFARCTYEYEDVGLAYYAGKTGDNWNKHALDFTIEGNQNDIEILQELNSDLKDAINKALKPSVSGFIIGDIYYLSSEESALDLPQSNVARLNADISTAKEVLKDLIQVSERLCSNSSYTNTSLENSINDYFRDALSFMGYNEVKDQTRHGVSISGKCAGEVDLLLTKNGKEIAIFEGLKLDNVNSKYIDEHIKKAIDNYNALGTATFVVAYVNVVNYDIFWAKYYEHISNYAHNMECKSAMKELTHPNAATRIAYEVLSKDGYDFPVYFMTIKIA
ncbi:MAG: hypothetical protein JNG49_06255 [Peptostreptococcus stomatis]|uniref:hypothetical protein n=1 Tax=Peptostreptococcus stomatis TaxID=341694 RepID=UPI001A3A06E0|nr:hypothetical protein [Peptostreptococcus stomatis]MBL6465997.1 hypothetical protein [Peptostreptococcus stomatis]